MGTPRGESTADADLRPTVAAVCVVLAVGVVQVLAFESVSGGPWYRLAVKLLLVPVPILGVVAIDATRETPDIWRPLYVGMVLLGVSTTTDALQLVVEVPPAFGVVFEDGALLVGTLAIVLGTVRWVGRRRAREADLAAQNERLDQFASVVSHDLRNPLNVAQMRLELARDGYGEEHLETVSAAHDRMEALIEDVLQLARSGEDVGDVEPVGLASVAADAVANTGLDAAALTVEDDAEFLADRRRLVAVFENLFRNALEHAGPDVEVRVGLVYDGFFVEDDGPGIPPEEQSRVFESGYTTDAEGTGLGLAIVAGVADAHDWAVSATTGESGGARFEFRDVDFETGDPSNGELSTSGRRP